MKIKLLCATACAVAATSLAPALAADGSPRGTQQERFAACAHESRGLHREEHNKFMSECLKGEAPTREASNEPAHAPSRRKACGEEAGRKGLSGAERDTFVNSCLER
jgi:psiF repeat-containing protein